MDFWGHYFGAIVVVGVGLRAARGALGSTWSARRRGRATPGKPRGPNRVVSAGEPDLVSGRVVAWQWLVCCTCMADSRLAGESLFPGRQPALRGYAPTGGWSNGDGPVGPRVIEGLRIATIGESNLVTCEKG
jgi:hypothetical protein